MCFIVFYASRRNYVYKNRQCTPETKCDGFFLHLQVKQLYWSIISANTQVHPFFFCMSRVLRDQAQKVTFFCVFHMRKDVARKVNLRRPIGSFAFLVRALPTAIHRTATADGVRVYLPLQAGQKLI